MARDRGAGGAEAPLRASSCTPTRNICASGITEWIHGWKRNGWRTADKKPVKNDDLWQRLDDGAQRHEIDWHWVKGHAGHEMNERADELARAGMKPFLPSAPAWQRGANERAEVYAGLPRSSANCSATMRSR